MTTLVQKTDALAECLWKLVDRCNGSIALYQTIIKDNKRVRAYVNDVERAIKGETYGNTFQDDLGDVCSEIDNVKGNYYVVDDEIALVKKILSATRHSMRQYVAAAEKTATDGSNVKPGDNRRKKTENSGRSGRNSDSWLGKMGKTAIRALAASTMFSVSPESDTVNYNLQDNNNNSSFQSYNPWAGAGRAGFNNWASGAGSNETIGNGLGNDAGGNHSFIDADGNPFSDNGQNGSAETDGGGQGANSLGGDNDSSNGPPGVISGVRNGRADFNNWASGAGSNETIGNGLGNDADGNHSFVTEDGNIDSANGQNGSAGTDGGGQGANPLGGDDDSSNGPPGVISGGDDGDASSTVGNDSVIEDNAGSGGNGETVDAGGDVRRDTTEDVYAGEPSNDGSEQTGSGQTGSAVSTAVDHRDTTSSGGTTFQSFVPNWLSSWARSNGGDGRGGSGANKKNGGVSERTDPTKLMNKLVSGGTSFINDNIRVVADVANAAKEAAKDTVATVANAVFGRNDPNVQNLEKILLGNWKIEATDDYCRGLMQKIVDNDPDGARKYLKDLKQRMIAHLRKEWVYAPQSYIDMFIEDRTRVFDEFIGEEDEAVRDATSQNG